MGVKLNLLKSFKGFYILAIIYLILATNSFTYFLNDIFSQEFVFQRHSGITRWGVCEPGKSQKPVRKHNTIYDNDVLFVLTVTIVMSNTQ